jgi:hypothetical protein
MHQKHLLEVLDIAEAIGAIFEKVFGTGYFSVPTWPTTVA